MIDGLGRILMLGFLDAAIVVLCVILAFCAGLIVLDAHVMRRKRYLAGLIAITAAGAALVLMAAILGVPQ